MLRSVKNAGDFNNVPIWTQSQGWLLTERCGSKEK
jgi:hypothetical protein